MALENSKPKTQKRWTITADKFLTSEQVMLLITHLTNARDLAIARGNHTQAIKDYYAIRCLLESGLREFEFCALNNSDFTGQKINVRKGKGGKPRTILLTKATCFMLKEWQLVKTKLGFSIAATDPLFPSRRGRYSTRGIRRRIKEVFTELKFPPKLSGHALRHTNCSLLLESKKVSLARIRDNLGHHSLAVTDLYAHATGNIDDVELLPNSSTTSSDKADVGEKNNQKKPSDFVKTFLSRPRESGRKNGGNDRG